MLTIQAHTTELAGTSYEIGYQLGSMTNAIPPLRQLHTAGFEGFGPEKAAEAREMFARWCPGLDEELQGFADALSIAPEQVFYYGMTWLLPRCSHIALLPGATKNSRPLLARNYEFNHEADDFTLIRTSVAGKYTHMGTSVLHFGRDDGFNEHGLAVTMSSCGFPVGPMPYMRAPKISGLQFWAVTRALLENCRDVAECLDYMQDMPIAYNLNMLLLDKSGRAALVETLDGHMAVKQIDGSGGQMLYATNHPVLPELVPHEPQALVHSLRRFEWIGEQLGSPSGVTVERLQAMLLAKYPDGLCCHYFEEFFGTTKSMVIDPAAGVIHLCWGGRAENGWRTFDIREPLVGAVTDIQLNFEKADPAIHRFQPLEV